MCQAFDTVDRQADTLKLPPDVIQSRKKHNFPEEAARKEGDLSKGLFLV